MVSHLTGTELIAAGMEDLRPEFMIYMDVSLACHSPLNSGLQRVIRGLYRHLIRTVPVTPLVWDRWIRSYCFLSKSELGMLESPFDGVTDEAIRDPAEFGNSKSRLQKVRRRVMHWRSRARLAKCMTPLDILFLPEFFPDGRIKEIDRLRGKTSVRTVAIFHDAIPWKAPEFTETPQPLFLAYMQALSRFDEAVSISEASAIDLRESWNLIPRAGHSLRLANITVMHWPVDDELLCEGASAVIGRSKAENKLSAIPKVLYVSSIQRRKNHFALLAACEQLWEEGQNFELILIGEVAREYGQKLTAAVKELQRQGRKIELRHHVEDAALARAYHECSFTVFPSLMEGFGLPVIESIRHRRPCVCSGSGAVGEIAAGGGCLMIDPTDVGDIANGIRELLIYPSKLDALKEETERRKFDDWDTYLQRLLPLLIGSR